MDDDEFKAEHQANVAAVQVAFDGLSMAELKHIAATQVVDAMYAEATNAKTFAILQNRIARQPLGVPGSSIAFAAGVEFGGATAIRLTINGMHYLKALSRSANAVDAAGARYAEDQKQQVIELIHTRWERLRARLGKRRWFSNFANKMVTAYPIIQDPNSIRHLITVWEKQHLKK